MTHEAQRIAIAEACGWTEITFTGVSYEGIIPKNVSPRYCNWHRPSPGPDENDPRAWYWLPDYLHDLNACHESVCSQSEEFQKQFAEALSARAGALHKWIHQLTAQDWADCFIFVLQSERDGGKVNA